MAFPGDFVWGAASSAFQIEGAGNVDGRKDSIWDVLCREDGGTYQKQHAEVATDHYHRFAEDVGIMREMGLRAYRFSFSWPRVLSDGTGAANEAGVAFYDRLIDALLDAGIEPFPTLYHWDLPYALQLRGGWMNRDIVEWFGAYTAVLADRFGDRVKRWMTLNEPQIFIGGGPDSHWSVASFRPMIHERLLANHHAMLAHSKADDVLRERCAITPEVGMAIVGVNWYSSSDDAESIDAARGRTLGVPKRDFWNNALYMEPVHRGEIHPEAIAHFGDELPKTIEADMAAMHRPMDFVGLNIYHGVPGRLDGNGEWKDDAEAVGRPRTALGWTITPASMEWCPRFIGERYGIPMYITENGLSNIDWVGTDGRVRDTQRIDYTRRYLRALERGIEGGNDVRGYMHWSILDNFEWACGFRERFGLVHVDYETLKRTPKDSAWWYADVIASNGERMDYNETAITERANGFAGMNAGMNVAGGVS